MFTSQRILSDSCLFYFLIFPKVLRKILFLSSYCSRNSFIYWVFLLPVYLLSLLCLLGILSSASFLWKDPFLAISHAYFLRLWVLRGFVSLCCHPVSPSWGVTVRRTVLPGLGELIFLCFRGRHWLQLLFQCLCVSLVVQSCEENNGICIVI